MPLAPVITSTSTRQEQKKTVATEPIKTYGFVKVVEPSKDYDVPQSPPVTSGHLKPFGFGTRPRVVDRPTFTPNVRFPEEDEPSFASPVTIQPSQINPDTLFGFAVNTVASPTQDKGPVRPKRPRKKEKPEVKPEASAAPPAPVISNSVADSTFYDPFAFQQQPKASGVLSLDEVRDLSYSDDGGEDQIFGGFVDAKGSHSQVTPDVLLPPPSPRQPKSVDDNDIESQIRRNMLMNIILRPGGGDHRRALPRPRVDVRTEGANVIVIRMTFPDNENIQVRHETSTFFLFLFNLGTVKQNPL